MNINVPDSIAHLSAPLAEFFQGMVFKLHANAHKKALSDDDIPGLLDKMAEEVAEFRESHGLGRDDNTLSETWDIANFSFLLYAWMRSRGAATLRERFIEEYFDIQPELGRVFCVKKRSGSKYGPGDEVEGTKRGGEVFIRTQDVVSGVSVSLPRSHLIWWKHHGEWPTGRLYHRNRDSGDDRIDNLAEEPVDLPRSPFVTQYQPKGREGSPNFGRWVYQRRHMFKLIRCGYYDSAEEAATEGLKAWKLKTQEQAVA